MIDLRSAKVGDKFIDNNGVDLKVLMTNEHDELVMQHPNNTFKVFYAKNGKGKNCSDTIVKSKIDPRAWWKDLPPAEFFFDSVHAVRYSSDNGWEYTNNFDHEKQYFHQNNIIKMCTCPETARDKAIKISDLKKWQEQNK